LSKIPVTRVSVYYYLIPIFGFFFAWWWKHETPTPGALFGAMLTLIGILIVERAARAKRARETSTPETAPPRPAAESLS
jgi:drug/metabolite transporter (DMT)-like permease